MCVRFAENKRSVGGVAKIITNATIAGRVINCACTLKAFCAIRATVQESKIELVNSTAITNTHMKRCALIADTFIVIAGK